MDSLKVSIAFVRQFVTDAMKSECILWNVCYMKKRAVLIFLEGIKTSIIKLLP